MKRKIVSIITMDIISEQDAAYYKSIHDDLEKEFKEAEKKMKQEEENRKRELENEPEPPKPTREQLRALRLSKLEPTPSSVLSKSINH